MPVECMLARCWPHEALRREARDILNCSREASGAEGMRRQKSGLEAETRVVSRTTSNRVLADHDRKFI